MTTPRTAPEILVAPEASPLERRAAAELHGYLENLFGVRAAVVEAVAADRKPRTGTPRFVLGQAGAAHLRGTGAEVPPLSNQGHLLRRVGKDTVVLAGGSAAALNWAVYELVQSGYGVSFLLHGDVLPEQPGPFRLPHVDAVMEPVLPLRSWRQFNDLPTSPGLWSLAQQRAFLRQVFKLKYNGIYVCLWPHHPFVDLEVDGVRRQTAAMLFGQHFPIGDDTPGRRHLPADMTVLDNHDFVGARTYEERLDVGRRYMANLLDEAASLGMHRALHMQPLEFPAEFRPLLQEPTEESIQLGGLTCAERGELTNPGHMKLLTANVEAYLEQWGDRVDEMHLSLPEHPQADRHFQAAWADLDARHGVERVRPLAQLLELATRDALVPGGQERAEREFKSAVAMLRFFDRLLSDTDLLGQARGRDLSLHVNLGGNAEPLFPILERTLWEGAGISTSLGYTASRAIRSLRALEHLDADRVPATLVVTLQDDNVGSLPQVATRSLDVLMGALQTHGWRGFFTRHWPIGDLDPPATYLARRAWRADETPASAYEYHFGGVYGAAAAPDLARVMHLLEDASVIMDLDFLGLFFPVLGILSRQLETDQPLPEGLRHIRATYQQALRMLDAVEPRVATTAGRAELDYWRSRLRFSVGALDEKHWLHEGARRVRQARQVAAMDADTLLAEARACFERALAAGEAALRAAAGQVRDETDANTLACYHHLFVREVREATERLLAGAAAVRGAVPGA